MSGKLNYKAAWFFLLTIALLVFAIVAVPVWLIQPFAAQTETKLQTSLLLKSWSPLLTLFAMLIVTALSVYIWLKSKRWFGKALLIAPIAFVLICVWFARQNHFEWMFNPLAQTENRFALLKEKLTEKNWSFSSNPKPKKWLTRKRAAFGIFRAQP